VGSKPKAEKTAEEKEKERARALGNALGNSLAFVPKKKAVVNTANLEPWEFDAAQLAKGCLMTKLPRWGKPKQGMFYLLKRPKKNAVVKRGSLYPAKEQMQGVKGEFKMAESTEKDKKEEGTHSQSSTSQSSTSQSTPSTSGKDKDKDKDKDKEKEGKEGKDDTKDQRQWVYCIEWTGTSGISRVPLNHEIQISFGQKTGQFLKAKYKKQYNNYDKRSFTIITKDRTLDLVCHEPEEFQRWQRVLKHLYPERV